MLHALNFSATDNQRIIFIGSSTNYANFSKLSKITQNYPNMSNFSMVTFCDLMSNLS